jgi:hypothetical protein
MGQVITIPQENTISLEGQDTILNDSYTVTRTGGEKEAGWIITNKPHECCDYTAEWIDKRAGKSDKKDPLIWRIFMESVKEDPNIHACGWRRVETFYPTRLEGSPDEILKWREELIRTLDEIQTPLVHPTSD